MASTLCSDSALSPELEIRRLKPTLFDLVLFLFGMLWNEIVPESASWTVSQVILPTSGVFKPRKKELVNFKSCVGIVEAIPSRVRRFSGNLLLHSQSFPSCCCIVRYEDAILFFKLQV